MDAGLNPDILIIGGGPAGSALALSLKNSPFSVTVLEANAESLADPRLLAMSQGSRLILERLGAWAQSTAIEKIHVSQKGGFGRAELSAQDCDVEALGYVLRYSDILSAMRRGCASPNIRILAGATATKIDLAERCVKIRYRDEESEIFAKLLVLAEGGSLLEGLPGFEVRGHDYRQTAVVAEVKTDRPHRNIAYERFTPEGPVALLPYADRFSLVWTMKPEEARELQALDEREFLARLQQHFGERAGRFQSFSNIGAFPLRLRYGEPVAASGLALIGNAAQALHPVSGQGFNLGLRDARALSAAILSGAEIGSDEMLAGYAASRRADRKNAISFTDSMIDIFASDALQLGRGMGLAALDMLPPLRRWFAGRMMFGVRG